MKKANWMMNALMAFALAVAVLGASGCKSSCPSCCAPQSQSGPAGGRENHATQYYCPMHPDVVQNSPGKCPKCGMDLMEKK